MSKMNGKIPSSLPIRYLASYPSPMLAYGIVDARQWPPCGPWVYLNDAGPIEPTYEELALQVSNPRYVYIEYGSCEADMRFVAHHASYQDEHTGDVVYCKGDHIRFSLLAARRYVAERPWLKNSICYFHPA